MAWYEIVLIVSSAVFLVTLVISLFFGDMDFDVHADGFLVGDVVSFKGLIHFCIGFSLTLTLMREFTLVSAAIGTVTGVVFVVVLYFLYRFAIQSLQQNIQYTNEIKEADAEVYFWNAQSGIGEVFITLEGRPVTVTLQCPEGTRLEKGQKIKVSGTRKTVHLHVESNHQPI
jgi:Ca2+/Na+ antiporter